jgi:hypothetical protein
MESAPTLVIPTAVDQFEKKISNAIGEVVRTCYSEINSSTENYDKAIAKLHKQNAELREFLAKAQHELVSIFDDLQSEIKKNNGQLKGSTILEIFVDKLVESNIYNDSKKIDCDKLSPLFTWRYSLKKSIQRVIDVMKETLDKKTVIFSSSQQLPEKLRDQLVLVCKEYNFEIEGLKGRKLNDSSDEIIEKKLADSLGALNSIVNEVISMHSDIENLRIHDAVELLMRGYLDYLQRGVQNLAPEWNLSISYCDLETLENPKIQPANIRASVKNAERKEKILWTF